MPVGGCLLTDFNFAAKVRDYFEYTPRISMDDMKFIKIGRHFRFQGIKVIGGRNETENKDLESWMGNRDYLITLTNAKMSQYFNSIHRNRSGCGFMDLETINALIHFASQATILYSDSETERIRFIIKGPNELQEERIVMRDLNFDLNPFRVEGN